MLSTTTAVILAAGQGTRMKSSVPKVLHTVAGRPLVFHPVRAALEAGCGEVVVVVGHGREAVEAYLARAFPGGKVKTAVQKEQRGTGARGTRGHETSSGNLHASHGAARHGGRKLRTTESRFRDRSVELPRTRAMVPYSVAIRDA